MLSTISQPVLLAPSTKAPSFIEKDVKMVLECVINKVERSVGKKQIKQRGAIHRESHTILFKAKALKELLYSENKSQYSVAEHFKVNQLLVSKWLKNKDDIFQQAAI